MKEPLCYGPGSKISPIFLTNKTVKTKDLNPSNRHIIKRQLLEFQGLSPADADGIEHRFLPLFKEKILPLIDQYCSQLSPGQEPFRIERLELDLGRLDAARLEEDFVEQAAAQLKSYFEQLIKVQHSQQPMKSKERRNLDRPALDRAILPPGAKEDTGAGKQQPQSQLELFHHFVETGSLPWWADLSAPDPVGDSLRYLLEAEPEALTFWMPRWVRQEGYLRRILRQLGFSDWAALAALPMRSTPPALATMISGLEGLLRQYEPWRRLPAHRLREQLGLKVLSWAFSQPEPAQDAPSFWKGLLLQLAAERQQLSYEQLLSAWRRQLEQEASAGRPYPGELAAVIGQLWEAVEKEAGAEPSPPPGQAGRQERVKCLLGRPLLPSGLETELRQMLAQLSGPALPAQELAALSARLDQLERGLPVKPEAAGQEQDAFSEANKLEQPLQTKPEAIDAIPDSFSEADELFIDNAGLVLLWPFLPRFFENLGLVADKAFVDEAAAHRAAGLLQFLADGQPEPAEYHCALNKILCGLDWDVVLDFGAPVTEAEAEAGEEFLRAVIAHAPILKEMSVDGFRGTFLLRKGILKAGPGIWQLYVERETYDVVLDKFPWYWAVVKLPWMEWGVGVEWG